MLTYFTQAQNVYAGEIRLFIFRDFQASLTKYLTHIHKEKNTPQLVTFVKQDRVKNQYCEVVGDLIPINFDRSENYRFLDIKYYSFKKINKFTLIYNEDRVAVLSLSQARCGIVGSFSLQGSGVSEQKVVKVSQSGNFSDIYVCTNKDRLIRLKIDPTGFLQPGGTFKLPERKLNTEITTFTEYDSNIIIGLNDGSLQWYKLIKTSMTAVLY